jgi:hypothetical protein
VVIKGHKGQRVGMSNLLIKTISDFDRSILNDLLGLFPGGSDVIDRLSNSEINSIINDFDLGGTNHTKVLHCMQGSTILISLVNPRGLYLWVCSLGDCQAGEFQSAVFYTAASFVFWIVLGTKNSSSAWTLIHPAMLYGQETTTPTLI